MSGGVAISQMEQFMRLKLNVNKRKRESNWCECFQNNKKEEAPATEVESVVNTKSTCKTYGRADKGPFLSCRV